MRIPNWVKGALLATAIAAIGPVGAIVKNATSGAGGGGAVDSVNGQTGVVVLGASDVSAGPNNATYITQTANGSLSAEQALGALATGILKSTTTTGVVSIAAEGTDYYAPGGTDVAFADGGTGLSSAADDTVMVSNSTAWQAKAIADCTDTGGNHLNYTASTNAFSCGTSNLSGITGLANPTASLGLTAINGSATTAMRSDGAPALDVTIAPTWTGIHTFSSAEPRTKWSETDATTDEKLYDFDCQTKVCAFRTRTDADGAGVNILAWTRGTGTAITNISFGNATSNPNGNWLGTGGFTFGGAVVTGSLTASNVTVNNSTVPGNGIYRPGTNRLGFSSNTTFRGEFDANGKFVANSGYLPDAGGMKHMRVTTGSVSAATTALVTCTWGTAFADANYTAQASVVEATTSSLSISVVHVESVAAGSMTVRVINNAAGSLTGTVQCLGIHD